VKVLLHLSSKKLFLMQVSKIHQLQGWGIAVLRIVTGIVFLLAGGDKLSVTGFIELGSLRLVSFVMVGSLVELLCGAALVVDLFTRWVSVPLALLMLADIVVFHPPYDFVEEDRGFEYALLRLAAIVTLALSGPGKVALDNVLAIRRGLR
jgi:putative oxidoreductase